MSERDTVADARTVDLPVPHTEMAEEQEVEEILSQVDDTTFIEEDWNIVVIETKSLSYSWEQLVVYLGLHVDVINNTVRPASNPWNEAINQWIKHNYNTKRFGLPSWRTLLKAVAQVNKLQFKELADKHRGDAELASGMGHSGTGTTNELHLASHEGDLEEVKLLIEKEGFNPLQTDGEDGLNALHYAAGGGQLGVMKYFIEERGCNPTCQDSKGSTPLHYAARNNHPELVRYLVDEENVDPTCAGDTLLHLACAGGSIDVVTFLVNAMTKYLPLKDVIELKGLDGTSPVHCATANGHLEVIKFFVTTLNFDPLVTDDHGHTALHYAARMGHLHIVKYFTEQLKCNPSVMNRKKMTPLHLASRMGHLEIVKYLTLEQHCDPLCAGMLGVIPLHVAAGYGQLEVVKFFVESLHCPADIRMGDNSTPTVLARDQGHHHVVQYLESITK